MMFLTFLKSFGIIRTPQLCEVQKVTGPASWWSSFPVSGAQIDHSYTPHISHLLCI